MNLNAEQIMDLGLLRDPLQYGQKAQIGYDLTVCRITKMKQGAIVGVTKNYIPEYEEVKLIEICLFDEKSEKFWHLEPGVYSLTFDQYCDLDNTHNARIVNRSSLQRAGGIIQSGVFDPGFSSQIGATLYVFSSMHIELHARIAQFVVFENYPSKVYNGQYQGEKDRK